MARQQKSAYEITDAEKRDLIQLIQEGKALPEKYRFVLFEDKREVELVWNGKTRDVCTTVLPFQSLEHIDEPRKAAPEIQADLFDTRGRQLKGWTNKLIWGDNKLILSSLKSGALRQQIEEAGGLKLIYIDPPFDVGADFSMDIEIGGETFHKEPNLLEQIAYRDTWERGADSFISMIYERLILMRDLLAENGSIYLHIGPAVNHFIRSVLDEVFGRGNSRREIIWKRVSSRSHGDYYPATHDYILFYSKTGSLAWNQLYEPLNGEYVESKYRFADPDGRRYRKDNCLNQNPDRPNLSYEWNGHTRTWRWTKDKMQALHDAGRLIYTKSGIPEYKRYLDESEGVALQSIWMDTHAGVDALRLRLKTHKVPNDKFRVDTIAGWCLRYSASFPMRSGLSCDSPKADKEWNAVYEAAARLIQSGAVEGVLASSYSGVFVDEYQDCTGLQHQVIKAIVAYLPVCVFGDPLQAIFDFKGQQPVDWDADVFPVFNKIGEMITPWRWRNAENGELANWLADVRRALEQGGMIDLTARPGCVTWERLPDDHRFRQSKIVGTCKRVMGKANNGRLVVIGDAANINARAALAQKLAAVGFSNIEPLGCKNLYEFAKKIEAAKGFDRLERSLDFICACMIGTEKKPFLDSVKSHQGGGRLGAAKFGDLITTGVAVAEGAADEALLELMQGFHRREATRPFRGEMFFAMRSALRLKAAREYDTLADAIWEVQNRIRHVGRTIGKRSIGSTLLVKGLEFDHAVIIHADNMSGKDWYVALTRATNSVTILSPAECFSPAA